MNLVGVVGSWAAGLTFVALTGKLLIMDFWLREPCDLTKPNDPNCLSVDLIMLAKEIVRFVIIAITIVVVAIPEGLPLAVTISLAYSVGKMRDENCLVRRLDASETMGGADQICTDKTGTLTQNQMNTKAIYIGGKSYIDNSFDTLNFNSIHFRDLLRESIGYNSTSYVEIRTEEEKEKDKNDKREYAAKGNSTEQGLIRFFLDHCGHEILKKMQEERTLDHLLRASIPFDSAYKMSFAAVKVPQDRNKIRIFGKGAPDFLLKYCTGILDANGDI